VCAARGAQVRCVPRLAPHNVARSAHGRCERERLPGINLVDDLNPVGRRDGGLGHGARGATSNERLDGSGLLGLRGVEGLGFRV